MGQQGGQSAESRSLSKTEGGHLLLAAGEGVGTALTDRKFGNFLNDLKAIEIIMGYDYDKCAPRARRSPQSAEERSRRSELPA